MSNINVTSDFDHSSFLKPKSCIINKKTNINSDFVKQVEKYYISETCKLSIATGPLYYISAQLQYLNHNFHDYFGRFDDFFELLQFQEHNHNY